MNNSESLGFNVSGSPAEQLAQTLAIAATEEAQRHAAIAARRDRWESKVSVAWLVVHGLASAWPPEKIEPEKPPAEVYAPGNPTPEAIRKEREKSRPKPTLRMVCMDDVVEEEVEWLWPGRIAVGQITAIMGRMGDGKSTLRDWLTATVSAGHPWPDVRDDNPAGGVVILQAEESKSRVVKKRLNGFHYGRGKMVHTVEATVFGEGDERWFSLQHDVPVLEETCAQLGNVRLVIIDPIGSYLGDMKGNSDIEVRRCLQPLRTFAEEHDLAVVMIGHPNKDESKDIVNRLSGSGAFAQFVRAFWFFSEDPRDKTRRLMSLVKENTPGTTKSAIGVHHNGRHGRMTWFTDPLNMSARQVDHLLQKQAAEAKLNTRGPDPALSRRALEFLMTLVKSGPTLQSAAKDQALNQGIKGSTFHRALKEAISFDGRVIRERRGEDPRWWLVYVEPPADDSALAESGPHPTSEVMSNGVDQGVWVPGSWEDDGGSAR